MIVRRALLACGAAALAAACASGPRTPPPELTGAPSNCPLPIAWPSPALTPRRIRISNPSDTAVVVVMDGCFRLSRLVEVPAHTTVQPPLPQRIVPFPEGIRFHAFIESEARYVGTWYVPPTPGPSLELVLDPRARRTGEIMAYDPVGAEAPEAAQLVEDSSGESYLMVPGIGEGGFLIFSCGHDRRWISLSTGKTLPQDSATVSLRYDRGDPNPAGRWEVLHSLTDAVLVPEELTDSLVVRMATAQLVSLQVETRETRVINGRKYSEIAGYGFRTEDLGTRLRDVSCFEDIVPKNADPR